MKCPKCGYLGFEAVERCRNCGYDFSLAEPAEQDAPLRLPEDTHAPEDLALIDAESSDAARPTPGPLAFRPRLDQWADDDRTSPELPLFEDEGAHQPLAARARVPRAPLAVRRATPDVPRARAAAPRMPMLDLAESDFEVPADAFAPRPAYRPPAEPTPSRTDLATDEALDPFEEAYKTATIGSRVAAVAFDILVLALIDAVVVYFTMQICGLTFDELAMLPRAPLAAFLILQNGGYWVAFTIGGQTLGKMAAGIRVVSTRRNMPLDFGHAVLRTFVWAMLAVPAGLGFLTALFSADHRGLHDRLAGTRVVRAAA